MPDEAEKNVLSAISMSEGSALLLAKTVCGEIFLKSGRFDEAENCLANVCLEYSLVCLKSRSAEDYFGFAAALDLLGDANTGKWRKKYYKRSLKLLKRLIETFPQDKYQHLYDTVQNKIKSI
jgi:tetratricopeptide (TPR) repeat protein